MELVLVPGRNVWKKATATRLEFLVDGSAFFSAVARALAGAQRMAFILGWDVDGRTLLPDPASGAPIALIDFLDRLAKRRPHLEIYVLAWDYSPVFALERQSFPALRFRFGAHERVRFHLDDAHPFGAAHHQKVIVVDDHVAFAGGMDLAVERWDTSDHLPGDLRRVGPDGQPFGPFHDVQVALEGPAAGLLGELARERWRRATGESLPRVGHGWAAPYEPGSSHVFGPLAVSIARTSPELGGEPAVTEVLASYRSMIRAARRSIYIENQYLTSTAIAQELAARLARPRGPEVVTVSPRACFGWVEERTLGRMRSRFVHTILAKAQGQRLCAVYPRVGDTDVFVHAKVMVVDDRFARVGSSNLSHRSMRVDTECDVIIEATSEDSEEARAVRWLRARLVSEHLGLAASEVDLALRAGASVKELFDRGGRGPRSAPPIPEILGSAHDRPLSEELVELADPAEPIDARRLLDVLGVRDALRHRRRGIVPRGLAVGALTVAAVLVWPDSVRAALRDIDAFAELQLALLVTCALLIQARAPLVGVAGLLGLVFGPAWGPLAAGAVATVSGAVAWVRGRWGLIAPAERPGLRRVAHAMKKRGWPAVVALRLAAGATTATVGLAAGVARLSLRAFLGGLVVSLVVAAVGGAWLGAAVGGILGRHQVHAGLVAAAAILLSAGAAVRSVLGARRSGSPALRRTQGRPARAERPRAELLGVARSSP